MELHIWDIDNRQIIVRLKDNFKKFLKSEIYKTGSFYKLGSKININYTSIHQIFETNRFPLYILLKIIGFLKLDKTLLEKNIKSYLCYKGKLEVKNPKFPIKEKPELYELIAHILGDGHLTLDTTKTSNYTNTSVELIERFKVLLNSVFGDVEVSSNKDKRFNAESLILPRIISIILVKLFPELLRREFPKRLFIGNINNFISFVRGFADDEGSVATSSIVLTSQNDDILKNIRKILLDSRILDQNEITKVVPKGNLFILTIKGQGIVKFQKRIGFIHKNKARRLRIEVDRKKNPQRVRGRGITKAEILGLLKQKPMDSLEISTALNLQPQIVRKHLSDLRDLGNIKIIDKRKYNVPVFVAVKGFLPNNQLRENSILTALRQDTFLSTKQVSEKVGLSKDQSLIYLKRLKSKELVSFEAKNRTFYWRLNEGRRTF